MAAVLHCELTIELFKKQTNIFQALISKFLKYFLSETIQAQENGSRGTSFAKFLISNFLKGLTYSALLLFVVMYYDRIWSGQERVAKGERKGAPGTHKAQTFFPNLVSDLNLIQDLVMTCCFFNICDIFQ